MYIFKKYTREKVGGKERGREGGRKERKVVGGRYIEVYFKFLFWFIKCFGSLFLMWNL